jgi:hypothetical protein
MHVRLNQQLDRVSGRSALTQAIRYALKQREGLTLFLGDDGWNGTALEIRTERGPRPSANPTPFRRNAYPRAANATPLNVRQRATICCGPNVSPSTRVEPSTPTIGDTSTVVAATDAGTSRKARNHAR